MRLGLRLGAAALASIAHLLCPAATAGEPAPKDAYREPLCLGTPGDVAGGTDEARTLLKVIRWPYAIEQPFHVFPADEVTPGEQLGDSVRVVFHGHSGLVLEGPVGEPWGEEFELFAGFPRGPDPGSVFCEEVPGLQIPPYRFATDRYTGNVFVSSFEDDLLDLLVIDPSGAELARIRANIFFRSPLPDLSRVPYPDLPREGRGEFYWFALDRLAGFVDVYRRIGGAAYAGFIVDAFLLESYVRAGAARGDDAGPRLPYLPSRESSDGPHTQEPADNLRGLRTTYRQVFVPDAPHKGGVSCALMPVLKMLEDRDCREDGEHAEPRSDDGKCPAYSAMALQTELFRRYPDTLRDRAYAFYQVFETLAEKGICSEGFYPMLDDISVGRTKSLDSLGKRAERELSRVMRARDSEDSASFREFLERTPGNRIDFDEHLPPLCRREMDRYRAQRPIAARDLVDIFSVQSMFEGALPQAASDELGQAQKEELFLLAVRLLKAGLLVGVAGDSGPLEQHAELAYGWDRDGFLLMDSDGEDETERRRTVIPVDEFKRSVAGIAFLRDEVEERRPTEAQLSRSLAIAPNLAWTHRRLGTIRHDDGRHREAVAALRRAVELQPDNARAWLDLGGSLQAIGRFADAVEATQRAVDLDGDNAYASAQLGYSLRKLGRLEEAERALRAAVSEQYSWEWRQLGWTLFDRGEDDEAERCFLRALEIDPQSSWNHVRLGEFLHYAGRPLESRDVLLSALERDFEAPDRVWIANTLSYFGHPADAIPPLRAVLEQDPASGAARLALARIHRRSGDDEQLTAILGPLERDLSIAVADGSVETSMLLELAYARALLGRTAELLETVASLLERRETLEGEELYELACIHGLHGDADRTLELLTAAFDRGFDDYRWARRDPDLESLSEDPRLKRLFARYGSHER